jgi:hypothetical protein
VQLNGAAVDADIEAPSVIWPRILTICGFQQGAAVTPDTGVFLDNPAFGDLRAHQPLIPGFGGPFKQQIGGGAPQQPTTLAVGTIVNEEVDFLTGVYADIDNNVNTGADRGGAEALVAIVSWGMKNKIEIGANPAANRGRIFVSPQAIISAPGEGQPPSVAFTFALSLYNPAFGAVAPHYTFPSKQFAWQVDP